MVSFGTLNLLRHPFLPVCAPPALDLHLGAGLSALCLPRLIAPSPACLQSDPSVILPAKVCFLSAPTATCLLFFLSSLLPVHLFPSIFYCTCPGLPPAIHACLLSALIVSCLSQFAFDVSASATCLSCLAPDCLLFRAHLAPVSHMSLATASAVLRLRRITFSLFINNIYNFLPRNNCK
jgi:hypothetical protein